MIQAHLELAKLNIVVSKSGKHPFPSVNLAEYIGLRFIILLDILHQNLRPSHPIYWQSHLVVLMRGVVFRSSDAMKDLSERISLTFASIDPDSWDKYRTGYINTSNRFDSLKVFDKCPIQCFVGYCLLINIWTTIRRDINDPPDGWVAMLVLGEFIEGHLYVPDLGISLPYKAGDVIFFRSWALKYLISLFQGNRYVVLFSTTRQIFEWLETLS
jgi:hypothetical protein